MTTERNIVLGIERLTRCTEFTNGTPSGNYNVTVANGSMTIEGEQDDHIRKNVLFADGQSYDIAINYLKGEDWTHGSLFAGTSNYKENVDKEGRDAEIEAEDNYNKHQNNR